MVQLDGGSRAEPSSHIHSADLPRKAQDPGVAAGSTEAKTPQCEIHTQRVSLDRSVTSQSLALSPSEYQ